MSEWHAGSRHGVIWPGGMALVDAGVPAAAVAELWRAAPDTLGGFLDALSRASGGSLARMPPFAAAVRLADGWHVAAKGGLRVEVDHGDTGSGAHRTVIEDTPGTMWTERQFDAVTGLRLDGAAADSDQAGWLPVDSGVVPAGALRWGQPVPEPTQPPIPEPVEERLRQAQPATPEPAQETGAPGSFAHLWGNTQLGESVRPSGQSPFAPPPPPPPQSQPPPAPPRQPPRQPTAGDHDGHTILAGRTPAPMNRPAAPPPGQVLAVFCPRQHPNPPQRPNCRLCGAPLASAPVQIPRPSLGRIVFAQGAIELIQPVLFGRTPRANQLRTTDLPRLVPLPFDHISGNHLQILLEGWSVLALDMHSTNGTVLRRPGEPVVRLPERPVPLRSGDVLDLGHGLRFTLEDLP